jgi:hypothetical protein
MGWRGYRHRVEGTSGPVGARLAAASGDD